MKEFIVFLAKAFGIGTIVFGVAYSIYDHEKLPIDWVMFIGFSVGVGALCTKVLEIASPVAPVGPPASGVAPPKAPRPTIRLIEGDAAALDRELFESPDSVVRGAEQILVVTGSRSRNIAYLEAIRERVRDTATLDYLRVLIGPPQREPLKEHLLAMAKLRDSGDWRPTKIQVAEFPIGGDYPERFICASEKKAVIITQSLSTPLSFDTGFVVDDARLAIRFVDQIRAAAEPYLRTRQAPPAAASHPPA